MWWNEYVGIPYKLSGRDRDGLDCWGLVRLIHKEQFGNDLPSFSDHDHSHEKIREIMAEQRENWVSTDTPKIGDVILFRVLGSPSHVGLYIGDQSFIHAKQGINSAIERYDSVYWRNRIVGFYRYDPNVAVFSGAPHPLKTYTINKSIEQGISVSKLIEDIKTENNIPKELITKDIIYINGELIPSEKWDLTIVEAGQRIEYRAVPTGDDVSAILQMVVVIAAFALAGPIAGSLGFAATGFAASVIQTGLMVAGSLLVNAIFPTRTPELRNELDTPKSQLIIQGGANQLNPFGSIPVVLGQFRFTPPLAAQNYSDVQASDAYLRTLLCWGYGPLAVSDIRIGDSSITSYRGVDIATLYDYSGDSGAEKTTFNNIYGKDVSQDVVNIELESDGKGDMAYTVTSNVCVVTYVAHPFSVGGFVQLTFNSGNGISGSYVVTAKTTDTFSVAMVVGNTSGVVNVSIASVIGSPWTTTVVEGLSSQIIVALHFPEGLRSQYIDGLTAGQITSATFRGQVQYRELDPNTLAPVTNWGDIRTSSISTTYQLGSAYFNVDNDTALESVYRWTRITVDEDGKVKRYDGAFTESQNSEPSGDLLTRLQQSTFGFNSVYTRLPDIGDGEEELWRVCVYGNSIVTTTDMRSVNITGGGITTSGTTITIASATITRAATNTISLGASGEEYFQRKDAFTYIRTFNVAYGKYEVRVRRMDDSNPDYESGGVKQRRMFKSILYSITGIANNSPVVAPTGTQLCMTAIRIQATDQLNGNVDGISGTVQSVCKDWTGSTWTVRPTRNPASLFRYVLQHPANAQAVADSKIDLTTLQTWHSYCSSNSFMFDMVILDRRSLLEVLRDICAAGRASPIFKDGKWSVIIDTTRSTVVQFFTPANSWGFESSKALPRLPHAFRVTFNNFEKSYQPDEYVVYNDGYSSSNATIFEQLALPGVTTKNQIFKHARFHLAQLKLRPETYSLNVDMENLLCNRGDLVRVQHDVPMWGLGSGRIKNRTSSTVIELDEAVPMDAGVQYTIRIRLADGTNITRTVASKPSDGYYDSITLTSSVTSTEAASGNLFMFGALNSETVQLIVQSIEPMDNLTAKLTLVDYSPDVYESDNEVIPAFNSQITRPPLLAQTFITAQPTIIEQISDETMILILSPGQFECRLKTTFANPANLPKNCKFIRAQMDYSNDKIVNFSQSQIIPVDQKYVIFGDVEQGANYTVRLRYESDDGRSGPWTTASPHTVTGATNPPKQVTGLTATVEGNKIRLDWDDNQEPDFSNYEVRTTNSNWGYGDRLFTGYVSNYLATAPASGSTITWYIKAVDIGKNYSTTATSVSYTSPSPANPTTLTSVFGTSATVATITLDWSDVDPLFGLDYYEVSYTGVTKTVKASTITLPADWIGSRTFTVKTVDLNGNKSSGAQLSVTKLIPDSPTGFRAQVIDNTVMLYWTLPATTSLPISHILVKKGASWSTATVIGDKSGGFTTINETVGGVYTYWIAAVDTDNRESDPVSVTANVASPPDFVFHGQFATTFSGTLSNAYNENGSLVVPVNTTETWSSHFTSRSWSTPDDQINAGYPIYIQPANSPGYYEEVFDATTLLASSQITLTYTGSTVSGTITITPKISISSDNITYTDYEGSDTIYAVNFRYVKIRLTFSGSDTSLYKLNNMDLRLDAKLLNDAGTVSALSTDANGTIVNFNKQFVDITSITATGLGTTAIIPVYDFSDTRLSATYAVTSNSCVVTYNSHGFISGQNVSFQNSTGTGVDGVYTITSTTTNTFTFTMTTANTSGNCLIYPQSFRIYLFNTSGTRLSATASWNAKGY